MMMMMMMTTMILTMTIVLCERSSEEIKPLVLVFLSHQVCIVLI